MFLWIRRKLGIQHPSVLKEFQTAVLTALSQIKGNQMTTQDQIDALTQQVQAFATAFSAFVDLASTSKQNDTNRIADLTAKWKTALAADAVDQTTIAQLTAQNTELNNASDVQGGTVSAQLQATQAALTDLQQKLTDATALFNAPTQDTTADSNIPPTGTSDSSMQAAPVSNSTNSPSTDGTLVQTGTETSSTDTDTVANDVSPLPNTEAHGTEEPASNINDITV